ncbi:MAG: UPF0149 family protein [Verrucomicrobia bacterium]|nr:UPF0149 family protein [Verrucomicrobiota bacterium]
MPRPPSHPLSEADCERLDQMLARVHNEHAMRNLEEIDGFFAALICGPYPVPFSDFMPEIWGAEPSDEVPCEVPFAGREEVQDFLSLLLQHWNSMVPMFNDGEVFLPFLVEDENGVAHGNDWARGFMRGMGFNEESWQALFDDKEQGALLIPIFILAYENHPEPALRPYREPIDAKRREDLLVHLAACVTRIHRYFASDRGLDVGFVAGKTQPAERKTGRNEPCPCGSGRKHKHCCGKSAPH